MYRGAQRIFRGNGTTLYGAIIVDTSHSRFVKTRRIHSTRSELQCELCSVDDVSVGS